MSEFNREAFNDEFARAMGERFNALAETEGVCPHNAFPEVTENDVLVAIVTEVVQSVAIAAAIGMSPDDIMRTLEHGVITLAAFALAYGRTEESVRNSATTADWQDLTAEDWKRLAEGVDWD